MEQFEKIATYERILNWQIKFNCLENMNPLVNKKTLQKQIRINTVKHNNEYEINLNNNLSKFLDFEFKTQTRSEKIKKFFLDNNVVRSDQNINNLCKSKWCEFNIHFNNECPWFGGYNNNLEEKTHANNEEICVVKKKRKCKISEKYKIKKKL